MTAAEIEQRIAAIEAIWLEVEVLKLRGQIEAAELTAELAEVDNAAG